MSSDEADPIQTDPNETAPGTPGRQDSGLDSQGDSPIYGIEPGEGQLIYDCTAWSGESRGLFGSLLEVKSIQHAWQGTVVSIRVEDEAVVDEIVDEVLASAAPPLDPDEPRLVYEVGGWHVALQTEFTDQLTVADVPYEWDADGNIMVRASDESQVEDVLELLPDPDESGISSDDGVAVHDLLNELFMRSDRLASRADDAGAIVGLVDATATLERLALPFGFEPAEWARLVNSAQATRDAIEATSGSERDSDEKLSGLAGTCRDIVRQYV